MAATTISAPFHSAPRLKKERKTQKKKGEYVENTRTVDLLSVQTSQAHKDLEITEIIEVRLKSELCAHASAAFRKRNNFFPEDVKINHAIKKK